MFGRSLKVSLYFLKLHAISFKLHHQKMTRGKRPSKRHDLHVIAKKVQEKKASYTQAKMSSVTPKKIPVDEVPVQVAEQLALLSESTCTKMKTEKETICRHHSHARDSTDMQ